MSLHGQVGLVTGATGGIGKAIALSLATRKMTLGLVGRDAIRLQALATQIRRTPLRAEVFRSDLTDDDDIRRLQSDLKQRLGSCDLLVHAAGIFRMGPIAQAPVDDLDQLYRTNLRASYVLTQALLPMLSDSRGQIVFINSSAGLMPRAEVAAYAASKHALKALADCLRAEVNCLGIRVLSVYPGRTATPLQESIHALEGAKYSPERLLQPEDVAGAVISALEMPRSAEVTDISIRPMLKT